MDTRNKIFTIVGAVAITAAAGIGGFALFATPDKSSSLGSPVVSSVTASTPQPAASVSSAAPATSSTPSNAYKDGTYTVSVAYRVPHGGQNSVDASITVSGGTITTVNATGNYTDGESSAYVDSFNSSVSSDATGQSLASYSPSRIGGASLTTEAFNSVLDTVRSKASA